MGIALIVLGICTVWCVIDIVKQINRIDDTE
jgi:hypothetical protein